jgi:hypothetical protein
MSNSSISVDAIWRAAPGGALKALDLIMGLGASAAGMMIGRFRVPVLAQGQPRGQKAENRHGGRQYEQKFDHFIALRPLPLVSVHKWWILVSGKARANFQPQAWSAIPRIENERERRRGRKMPFMDGHYPNTDTAEIK